MINKDVKNVRPLPRWRERVWIAALLIFLVSVSIPIVEGIAIVVEQERMNLWTQ